MILLRDRSTGIKVCKSRLSRLKPPFVEMSILKVISLFFILVGRERVNKQGNGMDIHISTRRGCVFMHPVEPNRRMRESQGWPYCYSKVYPWNFKLLDADIKLSFYFVLEFIKYVFFSESNINEKWTLFFIFLLFIWWMKLLFHRYQDWLFVFANYQVAQLSDLRQYYWFFSCCVLNYNTELYLFYLNVWIRHFWNNSVFLLLSFIYVSQSG